jgi:hypothetical protein
MKYNLGDQGQASQVSVSFNSITTTTYYYYYYTTTIDKIESDPKLNFQHFSYSEGPY